MRTRKRKKVHSRWNILCIILLVGVVGSILQGRVVADTQQTTPHLSATTDTKEREGRHDASLVKLTFPGMLYDSDSGSKLVQLATVYTTSPGQNSSEQQTRTRQPSSEGFSIKRIQILLIVTLLLTLGGIFISSRIPQMAGASGKSSRSRKITSQKAGARIKSSRIRKPAPSSVKNSGPRVRTNRSKKVAPQMAGVGAGASHTSGVAPQMYDTPLGNLTDLTSAYASPSKSKVTVAKKSPKPRPAAHNDILQDIPEKILLDDQRPQPQSARLSSLPEAPPALLRMTKTFFHQSHFEYTAHSGASGVLQATTAQYKRYGEIPVFFVKNILLNETLLQQISKTLSLQGRKSQGKIAFIIVDEPLPASLYQQIYKSKSDDRITIVPISSDIIARSVRNSTCSQAVDKIIASTLTPQNVYESNSPINNPLEFFGRDELLHSMLDSVGHLQHIGLFGLRGIGKTSLVWQLREQLSHNIVAYMDLQHVPRDCNYLYQSILKECIRDASFKYSDIKLPHVDTSDEALGEEKQGVTFIQTLVKLWEALKVGRHDIKIVLLLDEAEFFTPGSLEHDAGFAGFHEFMGIIRGISEQYGFLVSVIVSSRPEISRLDTWNGQSNPGFQFYKEVFLSSLPEAGCNQMIASLGAQIGLTYTEEALSRIYYETGGHPYVTRQLCGLIAKKSKELRDTEWPATSDRVSGTIQVQDVEDAISEYIEYKSDYIDSVWHRLSSTEQEIVLSILTNHSCALKDLIATTQSYDAKRQRRKAISTLIENEIIEKCENKYSIRMGLFERFLLSSN